MYTHKVIFRVGDGSKFLEADLGVVSGDLVYKFTSTSQPLSDNLIDDFRTFTNHVKEIAAEYGGLKEVSVKEIE